MNHYKRTEVGESYSEGLYFQASLIVSQTKSSQRALSNLDDSGRRNDGHNLEIPEKGFEGEEKLERDQ